MLQVRFCGEPDKKSDCDECNNTGKKKFLCSMLPSFSFKGQVDSGELGVQCAQVSWQCYVCCPHPLCLFPTRFTCGWGAVFPCPWLVGCGFVFKKSLTARFPISPALGSL